MKSLVRVLVCRRAGVVGRLLRGLVWTALSGLPHTGEGCRRTGKAVVEEGRGKQSARLC